MQPIHHVFFSSIDFVSLVEGAGVPLPRFQCALPFPVRSVLRNTLGEPQAVQALCCLKLPSHLS